MVDIEWTLKPEDIEWQMDWHGTPNKPPMEMIFEEEKALAHLLLNEVIFLNNHWWRKDLPEATRDEISINVNCNDVFAWACSDSETLPYCQIESLYRMWIKDPEWGAAVWCIQQRKQRPQAPVESGIKKGGVWDLDSMDLGPNTLDAETQALFAQVAARSRDDG